MLIVESVKNSIEQIQAERQNDVELADIQRGLAELSNEGIVVKRRYDIPTLSMFDSAYMQQLGKDMSK